jgi:hypothetical protein
MRQPVSGDHSIYHITVSHVPSSRGYLIRFDILFKPVGKVATIIVADRVDWLEVFSVQKP